MSTRRIRVAAATETGRADEALGARPSLSLRLAALILRLPKAAGVLGGTMLAVMLLRCALTLGPEPAATPMVAAVEGGPRVSQPLTQVAS